MYRITSEKRKLKTNSKRMSKGIKIILFSNVQKGNLK